MKESIKKLLVMCLCVSFLAVGCGKEELESKTQEGAATETVTDNDSSEKLYIPVISKGFSQQFWQTVKIGADQAGEEFGVEVEFVGPESETMVDKQVEQLETAMNKNPAAICLAALDSQALSPMLEKAEQQNIPVIGFDSGVDSDIPVTTAATDNYKAASQLAEEIGKLLNGEGEIGVIVSDQVGDSSVSRRDGLVETLAKDYPDIEVVDVLYGEGDPLKSTDLVKSMLQAYPDLGGFVALNEGSAVGVLNAVSELGKEGEIEILGFDSGKQQNEAVRSGIMAGAITQDPIGMGYNTVEAAVKAINGEVLPETIDTGFYYYTAENMDSDDIAPLLYE